MREISRARYLDYSRVKNRIGCKMGVESDSVVLGRRNYLAVPALSGGVVWLPTQHQLFQLTSQRP